MRYGSIYLLQNRITDLKYIGLTTTSVEARWTSHKCESSTCTYLHKAIRKHGPDSFTVLELASSWNKEYLEELESYFIALYGCIAPNGYNLTSGGGFHGKQSDITRQKKSEFHKTDWNRFTPGSDAHTSRLAGITKYVADKKRKLVAVNISNGNIIKYDACTKSPFSPGSTHNALRTGGYYKNNYWFYDTGQLDEEFRNLALLKLKGRWQPENINPIKGENLDTGEVIEFKNIFDAKDKLKLDVGLIRKCFTGRVTRAKNWKFTLK